jgi:outer membrane protein assembly factor BamB
MSAHARRYRWWLLSVAAVCVTGHTVLAVPPTKGQPINKNVGPGWPHLRGPHYDGIDSTCKLADSWPSRGPPVLWIRELGQGYSGFAVVAGRAYTQSQNLAGQYVMCLDATTGATLWEYRYDWPSKPAGSYPGPMATPTWHAGKIYFAAPSGLVGCLDDRTGAPLWSVNVKKVFGSSGTEFGYACTPSVEDGKVILPVGGPGASVVALDADTGKTIWKSGDDPASYCPALPITYRGRRCSLAFLRNALALFDVANGKQMWRQPISSDYDEHAAWPLYQEPDLMVASPMRAGAQLFRLEQVNQAITSRMVWASRELSNDIFSSVLVDGHVYGFDIRDLQAKEYRASRGQFKCLDWKTGKTLWATDKTGHANVLAADGKLILFNDQGTLILARINPQAYEELGRASIFHSGICWTAPALDRGRLFVRNQSQAACIFLGNPATLAKEDLSKAIGAVDLPQSISWDWTWILSREREYPFDAPRWSELRLWFAFSVLGVFLPAIVVGIATNGLVRCYRPDIARRAGWLAFGSSSIALGMVGTTLYSELWDTFVFTWPVSMFVAFQTMVQTSVHSGRQSANSRFRWGIRALMLIFVALCIGYYLICRKLGIVVGWGFLFGFLPAFPASVLVARLEKRSTPVAQLMLTLAFVLYFWGSGIFTMWKMRP